MEANGPKENRSQDILVLRIEIVPHLAVTVQHPAAIDVDIVATELEEGGGILIDLLETVFLPVLCIIRKLDVALDDCAAISSTILVGSVMGRSYQCQYASRTAYSMACQ